MSQAILEHITKLTAHLSAEEKLWLVEHLAKNLQQDKNEVHSKTRPSQSLRGIWKDYFPEDFEVESALKEIRQEWEKEWPEVFKE